MTVSPVWSALKGEVGAGVALIVATIAALAWANSPLAPYYTAILDQVLPIGFGDFALRKPVILWINDGLMAVFFLAVGLEIKRELVEGDLSSPSAAALPVLAALGGMAVPAAVYLAVSSGEAGAARGWAIPAATDIAFAVGVLAFLGRRVPASLRAFLLALAIIDDLGAILIIAAFYSHDVSWVALGAAAGAGAVLLALNLAGVRRLWSYLLVGAALWLAVLKSGIHPTLAGVALAFAIPLRGAGADLFHRLEHGLKDWVSFAIVPVFALANAGVSFAGMSLASLGEPVPLGIALGLFLGKQAGVMAAVAVAVKLLRLAPPPGASIMQIYGTAVLTGIGFTMSLFIGTLAFPDPQHATAVRLGVLGGSLLSAVVGYAVLRMAGRR
jgi:Na+:H+ antiporter, NhaA family